MKKLQLAGSLAVAILGIANALHAQTTTINTAVGTLSNQSYVNAGLPNVNITNTGSVTYSGTNTFTNSNFAPEPGFFENIDNSGSLTINGATVQESSNYSYSIVTEGGGTTLLTGGSYTATQYNNINNEGTTNISGGNYTGDADTNITNTSGSTTISGGSFNSGGNANVLNESGATGITGGTFTDNSNDDFNIGTGGGTLSISGGDITATPGQDVEQLYAQGGTITLTNLGDGTTVDLGEGGTGYDFDAGNNSVIDISGPGSFSKTGTITGSGLFTETYGGTTTSYTYNTTGSGSLFISVVPVPEPLPTTTLILGGMGIGLLAVRSRRKAVCDI